MSNEETLQVNQRDEEAHKRARAAMSDERKMEIYQQQQGYRARTTKLRID